MTRKFSDIENLMIQEHSHFLNEMLKSIKRKLNEIKKSNQQHKELIDEILSETKNKITLRDRFFRDCLREHQEIVSLP